VHAPHFHLTSLQAKRAISRIAVAKTGTLGGAWDGSPTQTTGNSAQKHPFLCTRPLWEVPLKDPGPGASPDRGHLRRPRNLSRTHHASDQTSGLVLNPISRRSPVTPTVTAFSCHLATATLRRRSWTLRIRRRLRLLCQRLAGLCRNSTTARLSFGFLVCATPSGHQPGTSRAPISPSMSGVGCTLARQ
jgi:hypothetical protein